MYLVRILIVVVILQRNKVCQNFLDWELDLRDFLCMKRCTIVGVAFLLKHALVLCASTERILWEFGQNWIIMLQPMHEEVYNCKSRYSSRSTYLFFMRASKKICGNCGIIVCHFDFSTKSYQWKKFANSGTWTHNIEFQDTRGPKFRMYSCFWGKRNLLSVHFL